MKKILPMFLILLLLAGCSPKEESDAPEGDSEKETVEVVRVVNGFLNANRPVSGILLAVNDAIVSAQTSGDVEGINIDEGESVGENDVVVNLDDSIVKSQLELAKAGYDQANAAYELAMDPYRLEDLKQARAALEAAKTAYDVAEADYNRNKELFTEGVISQQQLDLKRQVFESAHAQFVSARETLNKMEEGLRPEELEQAAAALASAEASLAIAKQNYSYAFLKSPFDGVVAEVFVDRGELVGPGTPVFRVVDPGELYIESSLSDFELAGLEVGQELEVAIDAVPGQVFPGVLSYIAGAADVISNVFTIHVTVNNDEGLLKPGMVAHSILIRTSGAARALVPVEAILTEDGRRFLFIIEDDGSGESGIAVKRPVKIMNFSSDFAEIVEGASEDEMVVVKGIRGLHDEAEVDYYISE